MSGYIGGILILSGCFMYGLSYSQRLKNRIIILKDMVRMLSVMNNHIGYSLIDMTQIFERLGDFDMCSYVRNFTGYIYEALNKSDIDTFALIWNEAADKAFAGIAARPVQRLNFLPAPYNRHRQWPCPVRRWCRRRCRRCRP